MYLVISIGWRHLAILLVLGYLEIPVGLGVLSEFGGLRVLSNLESWGT